MWELLCSIVRGLRVLIARCTHVRFCFFLQAEDGIRDLVRSRGLGDVYKRQRYPVPDDFILFVSTIEPRKNVQGLLKAFRRLLDDYKLDVTLVLAGARGWLSQEAYDLVHELKPVSYTHLTLPTSDLVSISVVAASLKKKKTEQEE